ncbi:hypothetical protein [Azomonas macrocytogenes]|uniref:Uncharacterized protein n=1 Tax=Azomonas macrocytogenes TaxID=69962 RepID=A0A839T428_AZOMA|nr:hypothetical protein [Azomonas macrocytogenes]MBB3103759.1 hypothetical protein [Azomonas macrocytogenes]
MTDNRNTAPQGLQASITAGIGTFATASCMKWLPPEDTQYWISVCTLLSPVVGYFVAKFFCSIDEPEELTKYKAWLNKDLTNQKKILKDKNVPEDVKKEVRQKYTETTLKLASANQDYSPRGIVVNDPD